jgi:general secretion pathway protein N
MSKLARMTAAALILLPAPGHAGDPPRLDALTATLQRPLFSPNRRPPAPAAKAKVVDTPPRAPDLILNAVVIGSELSVAWLKRDKGAKPVAITMGGDIDGWVVTEISPQQVVLDNNARSVTLGFPKRAGASAAAQK